jgi:cation diffusion facilitator family transporter
LAGSSEGRDRVRQALRERRGLLLSVWGAVGMAALGLVFFLLTHSQAVLLDGAFSLIGAAIGLVAVRVSTLVRRPDDEHFHFGYAAYEPMMNLSKGLLIGVVSLFALVVAVDALLSGGRQVNGSIAVVYALVAMVGCLAISFAQRRLARRTESPLLEVDSKNWLIDGLMSGAVAAAFLVVVLLEGTSWAWFMPYADPVVVIALALLSLPIPLGIIRANWGQLLGRAPAPEIQREATARVQEALAGLDGITPRLRLLETGRMYYLQIYLVLDSVTDLPGLEDMDRIRKRVYDSVMRDEPEVGLDVIFTTDLQWFRRTMPPVTLEETGSRP